MPGDKIPLWSTEENNKNWVCDETSLKCLITRSNYGSLEGHVIIPEKQLKYYYFSFFSYFLNGRSVNVEDLQNYRKFKIEF